MTKALAKRGGDVVSLIARQAWLDELRDTQRRLMEQVPEGRTLEYLVCQVCEDGRSLIVYGHFDGNEDSYCDIAASVRGLSYERGNPMVHPRAVIEGLQWLAANDAHLIPSMRDA